jgi:DNA polymerase III alpha subunit (gram-positive type)
MNVVTFDLETTGLDTEHDEIIQIGAVAWVLETGEVLGTFETKILPTAYGCQGLAKQQAEGFKNSYDSELWKAKGVPLALALQRFAGWVRKYCDWSRKSAKGNTYYTVQGMGHNAVKFDFPFLSRCCQQLNIFLPIDYRVWDTLQWAYVYYSVTGKEPPENYKLGTLCAALEVPLTDAHDALSDVYATAGITYKIHQKLTMAVQKSLDCDLAF